jgi:asparagine synthase (glutamine-hydrolysing)
MCGICGVAWTDEHAPLEQAVLDRMTDVLAHRGPDDRGTWSDRGVALGFRRLAIIDLVAGNQPMSNEDGTVWIVFNGEIYNFQSLRNRLEGLKHTFRTLSDTEAIVHLYEDEGPACLERLRGMFALAIWDGRERRLLLARDRLGKKPLVYRHEPGRIAFGSELKSLLQLPGVPRELDPTSLDHYLALQYVPHPRTIFRGIQKLPPGHYLIWQDGRITIERYWQLDFNREHDLTEAEYSRRLRETLTEATRLRMIADVPLGAFLSGGIDSTITVGLMQHAAAEPVKTFSIGFPVADFDETRYARLAAEHLKTDHHEFVVEPNCVEILPQLVWHYDEPFADSSAIPTFYVSQLTREHVTVALTGDAGDELFAGYPRYRAVKLASLFDDLPWAARALIASPLWQYLPASVRQKSKRRQFKKLVAHLRESPERRYARWVTIFDEPARADLYADDFIAELEDADPADLLLDSYSHSTKRDIVSRTSVVDIETYLPCDLLTKVDIASMANSLECRSPFLDHHVVELAVAMPASLKMPRLRGKHILRRTFADLLPRAIQRRGKMGFGVPLDSWFRGELSGYLQEILLDPLTLGRGYFRPDAVRRLIDDHLARRWDHAYRLWALLMFELWHRTYLDESEPPLAPPQSQLVTSNAHRLTPPVVPRENLKRI